MANGNYIMHSSKSLCLAATLLALTLAPVWTQADVDWYHAPSLAPADTGSGDGGSSDVAMSEIDLHAPSACFLYTSTTLPRSFVGFLVPGSVTVIA